MALGGKLFLVKRGTGVRVINKTGFMYDRTRVRILDGPQIGRRRLGAQRMGG